MGSYGTLWIPTDPYGFVWDPIESYGFLWIPIDSLRNLAWPGQARLELPESNKILIIP